MKPSAIARKDLNLLTVFEALYQERNVSRAAIRLNLTQSAVSHALQRLRDNFGDQLFVRAKGGIAPTALAQRIMPEVNEILGASKRLFEARNDFNPKTSDRLFRIGVPEYTGFILMRPLHDILQKEAPHINILTFNLIRSEWEDVMQEKRTDLIIGRFNVPTKAYAHEDLFTDDFVCLGGPRVKGIRNGRISLKDYLHAPHLNISLIGNFQYSRIDRTLAEMGEKRRFQMTVSNFGTALHLLEGSDMLLTVHRRLAQAVAGPHGLKIADLPFPSPSYETRQIWHRRYNDDAGHQWLRHAIVRAVKGG